MGKINTLMLESYRGIKNLNIDNLSNINIFLGNNNCGKTTILEAVKILEYPENISNIFRVPLYRSSAKNILDAVTSMYTFDNNEDEEKNYELTIAATIDGQNHINLNVTTHFEKKFALNNDTASELNSQKSLVALNFMLNNSNSLTTTNYLAGSINLTENSNVKHIDYKFSGLENERLNTGIQLYKCIYLHTNVNFYLSCVHYLSDAIIANKKNQLLSIINIFDKDINDISIVDQTIWVHSVKTGTMPLYNYGSGMQKALLLAGSLLKAKDGIILIDEIETAIHFSALKEVFGWFKTACRELNVQAFITTHSLEAVDAMLSICKDSNNDDIRVITLRKNKKSDTIAKIRSGKQAYLDREDYKMELRI